MTATLVIKRRAHVSPKANARMIGVLLLITVVAGVFAQGFIGERLIVAGNAGATAANILANEGLYRLAFAVYLIEMACQTTMTVLFYYLLEPVSRSVSLLAATFGLVGCTIKTLARLFFIAPVLILGGAHYLTVFTAEQLHALALLFLRVNYMAETMAMVFFGLYALVKGWLVFRSTFLPRVLGMLSAVGGLGWLLYLYEPFAARMQTYILVVAFIGTLVSVVWLIVVGVNEQRWKEQASGGVLLENGQ
jgi:hypothetical protein